MRLSYFLAICWLVFTGGTSEKTSVLSPKDVLLKTIEACEKFKGASFNIYKSERLRDGSLYNSELIVKIQSKPLQVYIYCIKPNPGTEVLYLDSRKDGKVLVHPNRFPFVNLYLDPNSPHLREHQHHSIKDMGFVFVGHLLRDKFEKDREYFLKHMVVKEHVEWEKKSYYQITATDVDFHFISHTVQKGENLYSLAKKYHVNESLILFYNNAVKDFTDVKHGQKVQIPSSYATRIVLLVDKISFLPMVQEIYDPKGLFEKFEYRSFINNPNFQPGEFSPDFKGYGF